MKARSPYLALHNAGGKGSLQATAWKEESSETGHVWLEEPILWDEDAKGLEFIRQRIREENVLRQKIPEEHG